jgi:hypothetical protein
MTYRLRNRSRLGLALTAAAFLAVTAVGLAAAAGHATANGGGRINIVTTADQ